MYISGIAKKDSLNNFYNFLKSTPVTEVYRNSETITPVQGTFLTPSGVSFDFNILNNIAVTYSVSLSPGDLISSFGESIKQLERDIRDSLGCRNCIGSCYSVCTDGCINQCTVTCGEAGCTAKCQSACKKDCDTSSSHASFCFGSCDSWCHGCGRTCWNNCQRACSTDCTSGCARSTCSSTCSSTCALTCVNSCINSCTSGCSNSSRVGTYEFAPYGCGSSCSSTCASGSDLAAKTAGTNNIPRG